MTFNLFFFAGQVDECVTVLDEIKHIHDTTREKIKQQRLILRPHVASCYKVVIQAACTVNDWKLGLQLVRRMRSLKLLRSSVMCIQIRDLGDLWNKTQCSLTAGSSETRRMLWGQVLSTCAR